MNCWHCDRPAHGACNFCGRGVCKDHAKSMPHIMTAYRTKNNRLKVIVADNALFCGICKPMEDPVELEERDEK